MVALLSQASIIFNRDDGNERGMCGEEGIVGVSSDLVSVMMQHEKKSSFLSNAGAGIDGGDNGVPGLHLSAGMVATSNTCVGWRAFCWHR